MSVDYRSYMASNDWAVRRVAAIQRSVRSIPPTRISVPRCEVCGKAGISFKNRVEDRRYRHPDSNGLNVHHLHYRNLGQESPEDLIVLCTDVLYYDNYDRAHNAWRRAGGKTSGYREPPYPDGVGCHERVHNDRAFKREVERIASERW